MSNRKTKDPNAVEPFFAIWCNEADGLNDGSANDNGYLQGATISTSTWLVDPGLAKDSDNKSAVNIAGVSYAANTVATIWLSGGKNGHTYKCINRIVTSDSRTQDKTIYITLKEN